MFFHKVYLHPDIRLPPPNPAQNPSKRRTCGFAAIAGHIICFFGY
jgi:hypothetical protein